MISILADGYILELEPFRHEQGLFVRATADHHKLKARDKVLDIGCGKRFFLFDFTKVVSGIGISGQII